MHKTAKLKEGEQDRLLKKRMLKAKKINKKNKEKTKPKKKLNWGYGKDGKVFKLEHLRFKPFTTAVTEEEKYGEAIALTGNLYGGQFIEGLPEGRWSMRYYDKPFPEYCVEGQFFNGIKSVEIADMDVNYDLIYHIVENEDVFGSIEQLKFRNCNMKDEQLKILCPLLWGAYLLNELDLSHNPIGDEGLIVIVKNIPSCSSLRILSLFDTQITTFGLEKFAHAYGKQQILITKLNIGGNPLNNSNTIKKFLGGIVKRSSPLEQLLMPNSALQSAEIAANMESALLLSGHLKYIDISFNHFSTEEELSSIINLFARSTSLKEMVLNFNPIGDKVLTAMLDCLFEYPKFDQPKTLYLESMTMPQVYFREKWDSFNRNDLTIIQGGVRKMKIPICDSFKYKLVKRFNFLYKTKKVKKDKVISTLQENLPKNLKRVKVDDFTDALMLIGKVDILLIQEIANEFSGGGSRANAQEFMDIYNELYPPKPKVPKKPVAGKKKKIKKK